MKLFMESRVVFDLNFALRRIHWAHSLATAFCLSSLRRRTSNSVPYRLFSR